MQIVKVQSFAYREILFFNDFQLMDDTGLLGVRVVQTTKDSADAATNTFLGK